MATHVCPDEVHKAWDRALAPLLVVRSGDVVEYELRDVTDGQLGPASTIEDYRRVDWERTYPLAGPVAVEDSQPGDVLEIEILDVEPAAWGFTGTVPGYGLLGEADFVEEAVYIWDLGHRVSTRFHDVATVPIRPFCGTMGVAPAAPGPHPAMPPGRFGGNLDCRRLTAGARLFLPVQVPGALFSLGDAHAAQGDGEVCVSAIECPAAARVRLTVHRGRRLAGPQFHVPPHAVVPPVPGGTYTTMGVAADLMTAAQEALTALIDHLGATYGLSANDAYILCSVVADLRIGEVVNRPNWIVTAEVPLGIFD